jgi:hypothetical protein
VTDELDPTASATASPETATPDPTASPAPPPAAPGSHRPSGAINPGPVQYKGEPLEPGRGPGLGCFRFQLVLLVILIVGTPLSVGRVPNIVTAALLFVTIALLLVSGQTMIFLLRLVAADRRGRRRPLAPRSPTVGQLEDGALPGATVPGAETAPTAGTGTAGDAEPIADATPTGPDEPGSPSTGPVRQ